MTQSLQLSSFQAQSSGETNVVSSFLKRHLPSNRLLKDEDNIDNRFIMLNKFKKKGKPARQMKKLTNKERKGIQAFKLQKEAQR